MASSPLSHADTFATAIIKVHSPHSFLSFSFDQSKHCSRGTSAFPFSHPQADTKVPRETEHKHSKVAVTQGRLVWELREPCALPPRLGEAHVQRSKRGPQILKSQTHLGMSGPHRQVDQACSPVNSNGGYSWQVEEVNFPADPSMTSKSHGQGISIINSGCFLTAYLCKVITNPIDKAIL